MRLDSRIAINPLRNLDGIRKGISDSASANYGARLAALKDAAASAGRDMAGITLSVSPRGKPIDAMAEDADRFRSVGAQHLWITATAFPPAFSSVIPALERFSTAVGIH